MEPPTSERRPRPPNPYVLAFAVLLAVVVVFGFTGLPIAVRILVAFAIVAAGAYLTVLLARRR